MHIYTQYIIYIYIYVPVWYNHVTEQCVEIYNFQPLLDGSWDHVLMDFHLRTARNGTSMGSKSRERRKVSLFGWLSILTYPEHFHIDRSLPQVKLPKSKVRMVFVNISSLLALQARPTGSEPWPGPHPWGPTWPNGPSQAMPSWSLYATGKAWAVGCAGGINQFGGLGGLKKSAKSPKLWGRPTKIRTRRGTKESRGEECQGDIDVSVWYSLGVS